MTAFVERIPVLERHTTSIKAETPPKQASIPKSNRKLAVFCAATALSTVYMYGDTVTQAVSDLKNVQTERSVQTDDSFVNNGIIGIRLSTYLPGVLDLERRNPRTNAWEGYNVIVPNVVAHNLENSTEIFNARTTMQQRIKPDGTVEFEIPYEKLQGLRVIDGQPIFGNGAHFKIVGEMRKDEPAVSISIVPNEDSAPIQNASLGNYFGAIKEVSEITIGEQTLHVTDYPEPHDGNLKNGDFYSPEISQSGEIVFGNDDNLFEQSQSFTNANRLDFEVREHQWRPEFGKMKLKPWIETIRVWQTKVKNKFPVWKFGWRNNDPKPTIELTTLLHN